MKSIGIREWASLETIDNEVWYHHHHCGRRTTDLAEVVSHQVLSVEIDGIGVSALQEDWKDREQCWRSIAFFTKKILSISLC